MDREHLIQVGWQRGSVIDLSLKENSILLENLPKKIQSYLIDKKAHAIISLYDCALVHSELDAEPWFYVFIGTEISNTIGNYKYGKNERKLHFQLDSSAESILLESNALTCNVMLDREILLNIQSSQAICPEQLEIALTWVSDRTTRPVFTDEFNKDVKKHAEKVFKDNRMASVSTIYLKETVTQDGNQNEIQVYMAVPESLGIKVYRNLKTEKQNAMTLEERMKSIFPITKYKATCKLLPESEISLAMLRTYKKWSPDYFSDRLESKSAEKAFIANKSF